MKHRRNRRFGVMTLVKGALIAAALAILMAAAANAAICLSTRGRVRALEDSLTDTGYDCIIVLGCQVWGDRPSHLLSDRLDVGIALYHAGVAPKILMSGDHGQTDYDEVNAMREYAMARGVPSEDIFMDHAGFSTYESMYRAWDIFGIERAVVVTQKYHLYRALYDASAFGIEAVGTAAEGHTFARRLRVKWEVREVAARAKDLIWCLFKPEPTYRGEKIDIHGNGEATMG